MSHDDNQELNPNMIMMMTVILVIAAFSTVGWIVTSSEAKNKAAAVGGE